MSTERLPHDAAYKQFFSDPDMVVSLLRDLVAEDFVDEMDFATLERVPGSYVTDDLRERHDDIVWRVGWKNGKWCYVVLLLEFQSAPDHWMALRMLSYTALLLLDLVKSGQARETEGLPPVFPVVIYNGGRVWQAPEDVAELFADMPPGLRAFRPACRYFLVDENRFGREELERGNRGPAAQLVRLERAADLDEVRALVRELVGQLADPKYARLRRMFTVWLRRVVFRRMGVERRVEEYHDLREVNAMLEENVGKWVDGYIRQGIAQGMARGMAQGQGQALLDYLEERFGETPQAALDYMAQPVDAEALRRLTRAAYRAASLDEILALLRKNDN